MGSVNQVTQATEQEMLVSLTLHNFSAEMLREFAVKIVKPYFGGNINEALRNLMVKAIDEETIVNQAVLHKNR
jgi:hypothetical protein